MRHLGILFISVVFGVITPLTVTAGPGNGAGQLASSVGCQPDGSPKDDDIICTGITPVAVEAGKGNDQVDIQTGATVSTAATDPQPQSTAVDGGEDNDTITNNGEVSVDIFSLGNNLKNIPALGTQNVNNSNANDDVKAAQAIGIAGGEGMDTITNIGVIDVNTLINTASIGLAGPPPGPAPKTRSSLAVGESVGIDGGSEDDSILNSGEINVSATSLVEIGDVSGTDSGSFDANSPKNEDTTANATAVGIRGGDGNDTITNDGDLHVMATTTGITVAVGGDASVVTPSSNHDSVFEAVATGVAGGAGNDAISNTGTDTIDVVSSATAPTVGVSLSMNGTHPAAFISTAKAESTGINGGDGDDLIMNAGGLNSTANADAAGMFGSIVPEGGGALFKADASGGVAAEASATGIAAEEGGDTITNTGDGVIQAEANATAIAGSGAIAIDGAAHAGATSRASADATGVDAGTGDDTILNQGEIDASANADASSMNIAFSQSGTADVKSAEEGGTSAEAKAVGVAGDNAASNKSSTMDLTLTPNGLILTKSGTETADGGADTLMNEATITANADARSGTKAAAVSIQGAAHGSSSSEAKAQATAIDAGAGSDTVANAPQGVLNANATATADAVNVAFSEEGEAEAAHDAGAAAVASATGISGDGEAGDSTKETTLDIGSDGFSITRYTSKTDAGGDDILSNDGLISAGSYALSGAGAAAISIQGAAQAGTTSKSTSTATGIDAGAGADTVTNGGEIHADAGADAGALNIAFSQGGGEATQAKSSVEGGATAEAGATGIAGDGSASETSTEYNLGVTTQRLSISRLKDEHAIGGDDTITNEHVITAAATARSLAGGGAISIEGAAEAGTTSTAKAGATGIDAGLGDDTVTNSATLTAEATAEAGALNVAFSQNGEATAKHDGGAIAEAAAAGISGDGEAAQSESETSLAIGTSGLQFAQHSLKQSLGGADTLINEDMINVVSTAISGAGGVAISIEGAAQADSTSRAESKAVAIDAGAGGDNVTNKTQGTLNVAANATAAALNVSFSQKEGAKATHDGGATASASATGLTGDGAASRRTTDTTIDISTSGLHVAHQTVETAIGGDDTLTNMGAINTNANALSLTGAAAISIEGAAQAGATSTANADATGIDGGIGGDTVMNTGEVHANATADAGALNLAFSQGGSSGEGGSTNSKSSVDGGATATASATGITGDGNASDSTSETTFDVDATGLHFAHRSGSQALGGNDSLTNESTVAAAATARSGALSGAVSIEGAAQAKSTSTATSTAAAIDGAAGADVIANSGPLTADANSTAIGLSVAVSPKKTATAAEGLWDGGATAEANATGISGDGNGQTRSSETMVDIGFQDPSLDAAYKSVTENPVGSDTITNSAHIDATATAVAPAVDVAISSEGMAAALSTASAKARAAAIDAGGAADEVTNHGSLDAQALANADAISVAVSGKKAAVAADTLWNGGTSAEAAATGIDADGTDARDTTSISGTINSDGFTVNLGLLQESLGGADTVINDAAINAGSIAVSAAGDVAVSAESVGGAISTSDADARATGIDAGGGGDEVTNQGALTVEADALAAAVNVAVSGKSAAIAADAVWDGGVNSEARAKGIDGDGIATNKTNETTLTIDGNGVGISHSASQTSAGGNDTISNESMIDATAVALAPSIDVAVATKGAAGAISTAHTAANAAAIDGGTGDDTITNTGQLNASADSVAAAVNVAVSGKSAAIAADAVWDGGTTAEASARGIDADGSATNSVSETSLAISGDGVTLHDGSSVANASGKDTIDNEAAVDANAVAVAPSISVPIAIKGVAVAAAASTAKAGASAIDAGNDDDTVNNSAKLTASSVANADAVNVAITTSGVAAAGGAIWGGDTTAEAISRGIDLDGSGVNSANETTLTINGTGLGFSHNESTEAASGNDMLTNTGEIDSTATAVSAGLAVGVAVEGVSTATSNSIARSRATAIDAGGGDDTIVNNKTGMLNATATSVAAAVNVAVDAGTGGAVAGNGLWDGGTTSVATAKGIDADGNATSSSNGTEIAVSGDGASLDHTESTTSASGDDTITNDATINANATVVVPSIDVAVAVSGMAVATSAFSALADAAAIDGGGGNDGIENYGKLDATAVANADAINVAVTPAGVAVAGNNVWDGGTTSEAVARGIDADGSGTNTSSETTLNFNSDGASFSHQTSLDAASGDDTIYNDAQIDAGATAVTAGIAVGVTAEGAAAAISSSTARSYATALDAGNGNDGITNTGNGELSANATSTAVALNVGVAAGTGLAVAADAVWDGGTTAEATAKGIDGDGSASSHTSATSIAIGGDGASISHSDSTTSASGDDTINNNATIDATAVSVAPSLSAAIAVSGVGVAASTATARAAATAIDGGGGNDGIENYGKLDATAVANADAINVAVTPAGVAVAGNNVWDGGTTSEAVARGIDADGSGTNTSSETTLNFNSDGASFSHQTSLDAASGDDTIYNDAQIDAGATAVTAGIAVGVTAEGAAAAISSSTARSYATALDAGNGNDGITNTGNGELSANATSTAVALNVGVAAGTGLAVAADAVWDGGTTAEATAKGIDGDGSASSHTSATSIAIGGDGASISHSDSTTSASGDDTINNNATIDATAVSVAPSLSAAVSVAGVGLAAATSTARTAATAIDGGGGNDEITNTGELSANATSTAVALNVSVTPAGVAVSGNNVWDGGTTSEAVAKGIDADGTGTNTSSETTLTFGGNGASFSQISNVDPAGGNDTVVNDAKIDASAVAVSPELSVAVAVEGASLALSNSTARAAVSGIDTGDGDDNITNHGTLDAGAVANADAVNVSGSNFGVNVAANAVWDGGTTAEAVATGIDADGKGKHVSKERDITLNGSGLEILDRTTRTSASGNDVINNDARINAHATAVGVSVSAAAEIPIDLLSAGVAAAISTSTAKSDATAIDGGGGNDSIINSGELDATAVSTAVTGNLTFSLIGIAASVDALWEGGTTAEATAAGIDADSGAGSITTEHRITADGTGVDFSDYTIAESLGGNDSVTNTGMITAQATAVSPSVAIGVAGILGAAGATSTATSHAVAISTGSGDDTVDNSGELTATASSTAVAVNLSAGAAGLSVNNVWDGGVKAEATTKGIDGGAGNDTIGNTASIDSEATATAPSVSIALGGIFGGAISTATTTANASAIDAGSGNDTVDNSGELTATADSTAVAVNVSESAGVALSVNNVWDGGTRSEATASGIDTGSGNDTVKNTAGTESMATATTPAVSVAFGGIVGAAVSTATSEAWASAIDTGDGNDSLTNSGQLTTTADANAVAVNVALTATGLAVAADAAWDGGTTAEAFATGIDGGKGDDALFNTASIDSTADANSTSVGVSTVLFGGVGASISTSTANSDSTAIDGGDGNDTIGNGGILTAVANSTATGVNVSLNLLGASVAADAVWDGGTTADAAAGGIDSGGGDDVIRNGNEVSAESNADSTSVGVSVTLVGVAGAASTSTAESHATAIDAGAGNDMVGNAGALTADAESDAGAVSVDANLAGIAAASDAVWDGGTTADAIAKGIDGGDGNDIVDNRAMVTANSTADASSTGVSVTVLGAAGAISAATANAQSTAIDGGAGDDAIANSGDLNADATADATGTSVSVGLVGFAGSDMSTTATATAAGVLGGGGSDVMDNSGHLDVNANATAAGTSVSVSVAGASLVDPLFDGNTSAQATAIGLGGEAGIDTITNTSNIDLTAAAQASSDGVSVGLIGFAGANAASTTMANATGIDGGEDADTLDNQGAITSTVTADSPAHAVGVNLAGASFVNASATAQAGSIGMDGGGGNDTIDNSGMITSTVTAHSPVRSVSVTLAGVASADYSSSAQADAIGIDGGQGNDVITNSGGIDLSATADAPVSGTSVGIFGVGEQDAGATASASAIGINGGDSNDQITNTNSGSVKAHATADAIVSGSSWNLAGVASQHGLASATVRATGIAGGSGMDTLVNDGSLDVDVDSTLKTQGNSSTLFGGTSADARVNGDLLATGIAGGDDGDQITNTGSATVNATSVMHADGSSLTLLGSARSSAGIDSLAQVIGIDGGSGADTITNTGTMDAETSSTATASSSSWTLAGSSGGSAGMTSESLAMGISGGDDNDAITNSVSGIIKAIAGSTTTVSGSSWTLAGKATDSGTLSALVGATGIDGGAGDDIIHNYGSVSVAGSATMTVNGGSKAIFGSAGSGSSVAASVNTTGINGNSGNDWILSTGSLSVTSSATMSSSKASFSFAGGASAGALLTATSSATGIIGGDDGDWIQNVGVLAVLAKAKQTASGGSSVSVGGSSSSSASSRAYANAVGVDLGNGADSTFNDGNITVDAEPTGTVNNSSSGGFLFGSAGTASALSLTATAHGDILGTGDNTAYNNGLGVISVTAGGSGTANANSDGGDIINGDANANANASGNGTAYGVRAESGNNTIFNYGALSVVAQPSVTANASANGNGADGDGNGTANATANGTAFGIAVGHGQNQITNNGNLTVQAKPKAVADAFADSDAGGTARATANATANANSTGILAGNGGNHIINNGTIAVSATPGGEANAHATDDAISVCIPFTSICATVEIGNKIATPHFTVSASAIGVQTGSGDDTVANYGTISTTGSNGVAISTGAGEDTVILGTNSSTTGKIDLGSDNDTLHLIGTPIVSGTIISGSGTDSLIFDGAGSFSNPLPGFAIAIKQGAGTFMIPTLSTMQRLEMNGGTLQINSNYTMSSTGVFQAQVNGDGTYGQLKSTGNVGLNGDLVVIKGPGVYVDGITYDIVSASNVSGSFASETLPAPTALVSFSTNQLPAAFQVEASVASFASVTTNSVGLSVGNALDNILPNATGDMAGLLSSFQELTKDELNNIYSGISGESYDQFRLGTMNVTQRYFGAIHSRMNLMRTAFRGLDVLEGVDRTTMAEDPLLAQFTPVSGIPGLADNRRPGERPPAYGLWVSAFGQAAKHRGGDGYSSFNDRTVGVPFGMDFTVGRNVIAGFAAGQSFSNMIHASALGRTEGAFSAVYGTYFTRNAQVETVVSHGWYKYENTRVVDLGNEKRLASSQHSGDVLSAKVEGRYLLDLDGLNVQPYVSLHFDRLAEQGFREYGAGSLDLIVKKSRTDYLTSQLGFHMVHLFSLESGKLIPEFTAAWKHDFTAGRGAITAAFSGAPDVSYRLRDNDTGNDGLQLGGALTFAGNGNFSASAGFNTELGTKRRETSALMRFQYKW